MIIMQCSRLKVPNSSISFVPILCCCHHLIETMCTNTQINEYISNPHIFNSIISLHAYDYKYYCLYFCITPFNSFAPLTRLFMIFFSAERSGQLAMNTQIHKVKWPTIHANWKRFTTLIRFKREPLSSLRLLKESRTIIKIIIFFTIWSSPCFTICKIVSNGLLFVVYV